MPPRSNDAGKDTAKEEQKKEPVEQKGTPVTPPTPVEPVIPPVNEEELKAKDAELKKEQEAREQAEAEAKKKDEEIAELSKKLKEQEDQAEQAKKAQDGTHPVVQAQAKKARLTKVKFIKDHSFQTGVTKHNCSKDDVLEVEPHLANKLVSRQIAFIIG